jgi:hypothetical protein
MSATSLARNAKHDLLHHSTRNLPFDHLKKIIDFSGCEVKGRTNTLNTFAAELKYRLRVRSRFFL